jgi:hypothetical protein
MLGKEEPNYAKGYLAAQYRAFHTLLECTMGERMRSAITAAIGAALGLAALWLGLRFHIGSWFLDGPISYAAAIIAGAVVALIIRRLLGKELGLE